MLSTKEFFKKHSQPVDKVIFLDFDGVLSCSRTYMFADGNLAFDPVAVKILQNICEIGNARIVCTSTRTGMAGRDYDLLYHETKVHFERAGFDWSFMHPDWTVNKPDFLDRKGNIEKYLERHPEIKKWAIVDDEKVDMPEFVKIDENNGISYENFEEICIFLNVSMADVHEIDYYKEGDIGQYLLPFDSWNTDWNEKFVRKENKLKQP